MEAIENIKSETDIKETDIDISEQSEDHFIVIPKKEENDDETKLEAVDPLFVKEIGESGITSITLY